MAKIKRNPLETSIHLEYQHIKKNYNCGPNTMDWIQNLVYMEIKC